MTPQEAADLVLTCTATGRSGAPLWEFMPGMQTTPADPDDYRSLRGRVTYINDKLLRIANTRGGLTDTYYTAVRPDFTDDLTVQALYLLVVRAYPDHPITLHTLPFGSLDIGSLSPGHVEIVINEHRVPPVFSYVGPAYAVFARALAAAPIKENDHG